MNRQSMVVALVSFALCGCGDKTPSVKEAGESVGQAMTEFAHGVGKGIDKKLEVEVEVADALRAQGVSATTSKRLGIDGTKEEKGIIVYFIASKPVKAQFIAKALNGAGQEIGRSAVFVDLTADEAKYVTFLFTKEMDSLAAEKFRVEAKPTAE